MMNLRLARLPQGNVTQGTAKCLEQMLHYGGGVRPVAFELAQVGVPRVDRNH
jgi:hypothetical protein